MRTGVRFFWTRDGTSDGELASPQQGRKQMKSSQSTCLRVWFDLSIVRLLAIMILCHANQHKRCPLTLLALFYICWHYFISVLNLSY